MLLAGISPFVQFGALVGFVGMLKPRTGLLNGALWQLFDALSLVFRLWHSVLKVRTIGTISKPV